MVWFFHRLFWFQLYPLLDLRVPIWMIGVYAMNFLKPVQMFLSGQYNRSVTMIQLSPSRASIHWIGRAIVWAMCHGLPFYLFPTWKAVLFAIVPSVVVSVSFMLSSQVNHLAHDNVDKYDPDFYKHQVKTYSRAICNCLNWLARF